MALSYLTESEAPRDFRVSSTDSDGHYTKCVLCYTVKRNFYCSECLRAGNFVHSSMPYSDRFAEKQAKLIRLKANRRHVLDRCEKLLLPKIKRDSLVTEAKRARDRIDLLRLAIVQRQNNIDNRRKDLTELLQNNNELRLKLPRYQKRVSSVCMAANAARVGGAARAGECGARGAALAALRRARIRQLTLYIFPLYLTYDASDSLEALEFVVCCLDPAPAPPAAPSPPGRLHILSAWMHITGDYDYIPDDMCGKECETIPPPMSRLPAALGLTAQLAALVAHTLQCPTGVVLPVHECYQWAGWGRWRALRRRLAGLGAALAARAGLTAPGLRGLTTVCAAANAHTTTVGRVEGWLSESVLAGWEEEVEEEDLEPEPPEHLCWPEQEEHQPASVPAPPAGPAPSLVTSAAASIVSMWRGWTK